jgi:hypothetical protein
MPIQRSNSRAFFSIPSPLAGQGQGCLEIVIASASEAIHSAAEREKDGLLRRFAPRNDDRHDFAISRLDTPEVCQKFPYPLDQRAQGMPGARCAR